MEEGGGHLAHGDGRGRRGRRVEPRHHDQPGQQQRADQISGVGEGPVLEQPPGQGRADKQAGREAGRQAGKQTGGRRRAGRVAMCDRERGRGKLKRTSVTAAAAAATNNNIAHLGYLQHLQ